MYRRPCIAGHVSPAVYRRPCIARPCIDWAVEHLLPLELSNSAGLTKADNQLHVHLWLFTERAYWDEDLRAWAGCWNSRKQNKIIDPAVFQAEQPHFTSRPQLLDGVEDPFSGRRVGLVRRRRRTVPLRMSTLEEIAEEARRKR
jgi:hypothetical protein